jgi:transcriptional regulator with XRE-family HTH domain
MVIVMNNNEFDLYEAIAANIKKYRKSTNITQAELSERVGVSHEFIRRIESKKGTKTFSVDTLYKISLALDISISKLFEFDNK